MKKSILTLLFICTVSALFAQEENIIKGPGKSKGGATNSGTRIGTPVTGLESETERAQKVRTKSNGPNDRTINLGNTMPNRLRISNTTTEGKQGGTFEISLNDEVLEVNTNAKIIKGPGKSKGGATQSGSRGLPVKGGDVKGGKNPGPNHKILSPNEDGSYFLPKEWGAGNYRLEILFPDTEPSVIVLINIDENGTASIQPGSNFRGAGSPKASGF